MRIANLHDQTFLLHDKELPVTVLKLLWFEPMQLWVLLLRSVRSGEIQKGSTVVFTVRISLNLLEFGFADKEPVSAPGPTKGTIILNSPVLL